MATEPDPRDWIYVDAPTAQRRPRKPRTVTLPAAEWREELDDGDGQPTGRLRAQLSINGTDAELVLTPLSDVTSWQLPAEQRLELRVSGCRYSVAGVTSALGHARAKQVFVDRASTI